MAKQRTPGHQNLDRGVARGRGAGWWVQTIPRTRCQISKSVQSAGVGLAAGDRKWSQKVWNWIKAWMEHKLRNNPGDQITVFHCIAKGEPKHCLFGGSCLVRAGLPGWKTQGQINNTLWWFRSGGTSIHTSKIPWYPKVCRPTQTFTLFRTTFVLVLFLMLRISHSSFKGRSLSD